MLKVSRILNAEVEWPKKPSWDGYDKVMNDKDDDEDAQVERTKALGKLSAQEIESGKLSKLIEGLKKPKALRNLVTWADSFCKYRGSGSSRVVYQLDRDHALKIAKNEAGCAQNRVESHIAQKLHDLPITKVHYLDPQGMFLLVDYAHKLNLDHFKAKYGVRFMEFIDFFSLISEWPREKKKELWTKIPDASKKLIASLLRHGIKDIYDKYQWGDLHGEPVLVDYGMDKQVGKEFYSGGVN